MNDLQWRRELDGKRVDHGSTVAAELGYTPIYLRYNTGLSIAHNAATLNKLLENTLNDWPVEVAELSVVAHSMGGLLTRHAIHQATKSGADWPKRVKNAVFLGTPHLGAPLEKAGAWVQTLMGATPYSAPFVSLSGLRSAGITDLRHGISDAEVPLTPGIEWYSVAATTTNSVAYWRTS